MAISFHFNMLHFRIQPGQSLFDGPPPPLANKVGEFCRCSNTNNITCGPEEPQALSESPQKAVDILSIHRKGNQHITYRLCKKVDP